jgi:C4-dicarboxylate-specific signal transduction histidine kinase
MSQAVAQARRAADVVGRLRAAVERPNLPASEGSAGTVDLAAVLRRALHLLEPECRQRGIVPDLQTTEALRVRADPVALDQIVHNLLTNALQAMDTVDASQRALKLVVQRSGGAGEIVVADHGPGIAPEVLPRLFEPFFSTREGGLGLGLPLCETLAQGMGGSLVAANRPGGGAVFTLRLPLQESA